MKEEESTKNSFPMDGVFYKKLMEINGKLKQEMQIKSSFRLYQPKKKPGPILLSG